MGLLPFEHKNRKYWMELDLHNAKRKTELPIEALHAVFIETGEPSESPEHIANSLNQDGVPFERGSKYAGYENRVLEIVKRAKQSNAEIWLGDIKSSRGDQIKEIIALSSGVLLRQQIIAALGGDHILQIAGSTASPTIIGGLLLSKKGNVKKLKISRFVVDMVKRLDPTAHRRNFIMANKIDNLAEITGHTNIGILCGAAHVGMTSMLEKPKLLKARQRAAFEKYEKGLKMYRCAYDKQTEKWKVEEHSL